MSAEARLKELNEYRNGRNKAMSLEVIRGGIAESEPKWKMYSDGVKMELVEAAKVKAVAASASKLAAIRDRITSEMRDVKLSFEKIKYPLRSSKDAAQKTVGTQQHTNALLFLSSNPNNERIALEIRGGLDRGETDYAFAIAENCLNGVARDVTGQSKPTEQQKQLQAEVDAIIAAFEGSAKMKELEKELSLYMTAEFIVNDFQEQAAKGRQYVISPELFPWLSQTEQNESFAQAQANGNLTETINFKRRMQDAMRTK